MNIKILYQSNKTGNVFEIHELCSNVTYSAYLYNQPSKFTCTIQKDPTDRIVITNGSILSLQIDNDKIFYGYITDISQDATETYKITAYDQLFYLVKNKETYVISGMTGTQIYDMVCRDFDMKHISYFNSSEVLPAQSFDIQPRYAPIVYAVEQILLKEGKKCFIRDDFGTIIWDNLENQKTNLVIGEKSLLTNYQYELSISKEVYNRVKLLRDNEKTGGRDSYIVEDRKSQKLWGTLQYTGKVDKDTNNAMMRELAQVILKSRNKENKTIKLTALGVRQLKQGHGFILNLPSLNIKEYMWIENIVHTNITEENHIMQIEAFII